jgi:hypothetical protein
VSKLFFHSGAAVASRPSGTNLFTRDTLVAPGALQIMMSPIGATLSAGSYGISGPLSMKTKAAATRSESAPQTTGILVQGVTTRIKTTAKR